MRQRSPHEEDDYFDDDGWGDEDERWRCKNRVWFWEDLSKLKTKLYVNSFTDEDLTKIYNNANDIGKDKNQPITTERIFKAMRACLRYNLTELDKIIHDEKNYG